MRECGGICLAKDRDQWWTCVNAVMNLNVTKVTVIK